MARKPGAGPASFLSHARLIGAITLLSRILGLGREMIAAAYFGPVAWSAFTIAFTIPNLFRKLFGEGALSAAFIPMYARMVAAREGPRPRGPSEQLPREVEAGDQAGPVDLENHPDPSHHTAPSDGPRGRGPSQDAASFAAASVSLLVYILIAVTLAGELILGAIGLFVNRGRPDYALALVLTAIMLPYVVLICGAAFLGGILNVHGRFAAPAAASVLLNLCLIAAIVGGALVFD